MIKSSIRDSLVIVSVITISLIVFIISSLSNSVSVAQDDNLENSPPKNQSLQQTKISENSKNSSNDSSVGILLIVGVFGHIIAGASATVAYFTYRYQRRVAIATHIYQRKQYQLNALVQVFNLLSNERHITARDNVEKTFQIYNSQKVGARDIGLFDQPNVSADVELVKADFEQIGALVRNDLIDKKTILDAYGLVIEKYWQYLEDHINAKAMKSPNYLTNFRSIASDAEKHVLS
jgi:hypothetical protein